MSMSRRKIREYIYKLVFGIEFHEKEYLTRQAGLILDEAIDEDADFRDDGYIMAKFEKIVDNLDEIDKKLDAQMDKWSMDRIGKSELAILRLAAYEVLYDADIPVKVAINEAVELSKKYAGEDAYSFVNAVLGGLARAENKA